MAREQELSNLVQKLLSQQQRLKEMYSELSAPRPVHPMLRSDRKLASRTPGEKAADATKRSMHSWIVGSEYDPTVNEHEYTDEEIEELRIFRKTNFSECHDERGLSLPAVNYPPPPKESYQYDKIFPKSHNEDDAYHVENYSLNSRMFPVRTDTPPNEEEGSNDLQAKKRLIQVSIPYSNDNQSGYTFKPKSRKSFDSVNTMGLAKHCIKGYKTAQYPALPVHKLMSFKSFLRKDENS